MIWSVSTLLRRSGTPMPVWVVKASTSGLLDGFEVGGRAEGPADRRGGGHGNRDQMGPPALALPSLEVPIGRGRAALLWRELVGVHAEAHRAAGAAPLTTGLLEDHIEALVLGLQPDAHRPGNDEGPGAVRHLASLDDLRRCSHVPDPGVGAGPHEDRVDRDV